MSERFDVSVVIPVRDGLPDVLDAVESALAQSVAPAEIVIVDDGSTDGSADAVERRFGERVRLVRGRFGSAAAARNAGAAAARGEWIAWLDADDLWLPDKLATVQRTLAAAPSADWFFSDGAFRTLDGQLHASWFALYADVVEPYVGRPIAQLLEVNFVLTSSVVVRRSAFADVRGFDEGLSHAEDLDLWIRLARRGPAAASRRALVRYQHRAGGLTRQTEQRLGGGATLFERLAADPTLEPAWRRGARRRAALYRYKLAMQALRTGEHAQCRRRLGRAWLFPDLALQVSVLWTLSLLPHAWLRRLHRRPEARDVAISFGALRRVTLRGDGASGAAQDAAGRAAGGRA